MKKNENKKKKTLIVIIVIVLLLVIVGCFLIFNKKKDYISELPNPEENPILENIKTQMTLDNSMEGFANFTSQLYGIIYSIDSIVAENPENFDDIIASQMETLDAYMSVYDNYDSYVNSLDNKTYSSLKSNWKKFAKQAKDLYNEIKGNHYTKGNHFIPNDSFEKTFTNLSTEIGKFANSSNGGNTSNSDTSTPEPTPEAPAAGSSEESTEEQPSEENANPEEATPAE